MPKDGHCRRMLDGVTRNLCDLVTRSEAEVKGDEIKRLRKKLNAALLGDDDKATQRIIEELKVLRNGRKKRRSSRG